MARTAGSAYEVEGLQQVLRELSKFHPDLVKELKQDLQKQARPIIQAAARRVPDIAASGWSSRGRTGYSRAKIISGMKVSMRTSKRMKGVRGSYAAIEIYQANAAGAIWDQAGTKGQYKPPVQRGAAFIDALTRSGGKPQRGLWPSSLGRRGDIARAFEQSIRETTAKANARMRSRI